MERRFTTQPVKIEKRDDGAQLISGYGAVFYDGTPETQYELWEGYVERIMPGAFDRAIAEKADVRGLFNHDANQILGRTAAGTMRLSIDAKGLRYEIDPGDTSIAKDVQEHLRRRDVTGSSFAFNVTDSDQRQQDNVWISEIRGVQLFDCGPVTYPAYEATEANCRSADAAKKRFDDLKNNIQRGVQTVIACAMARARAVEIG